MPLQEISVLIDLIRQRLASYDAKNALEEEQAAKEFLQEVALYLLWRGGFFEVAAFQGGTSLRILLESGCTCREIYS